MSNDLQNAPIRGRVHQRAKVSLALGSRTKFTAEARLTNGGLLSIAVLVSAILLSTAVLVHTAAKQRAGG